MQGIPAEKVTAAVGVENGELSYDVTAESLGGKIKFQGKVPLNAAPPAEANGNFRAVGFTLARLWKAAGMTGIVSRLEGLGAVNANVRLVRGRGRGALGARRGRVPRPAMGEALSDRPPPRGLRHDAGRLVGRPDQRRGARRPGVGIGPGQDPGGRPPRIGIDLRIDRAVLAHVVAFLPSLAPLLDGFGTFQLTGTLADVFQANIDVAVAQARLAGLPLSELRAPAMLVVTPGRGPARCASRGCRSASRGGGPGRPPVPAR